MDRFYYEVDFCRCKTSTEKTMNRKFAENDDCIVWYEDAENIFFGDCACDEKQVAEWIKNNLGEFNPDCWMAGDYSLENVLD